MIRKMKLKNGFCALGILFLLGSVQNGLGKSISKNALGSVIGKIAFTTFLTVFDLQTANALPPFRPRMEGPPGSGSVEEDSEEEDNESQARVEPQITPLNRDDCLAKLLCGMSVPVTGGGAPKNGYYSEYANIVAKFFDAFPLEGDDQSLESIEAYDDYSAEDDRPTRINSKKKKTDGTSSTGLQLIDLALIKTAQPDSTKNQTQLEDDERNDRSVFNNRQARARKAIAKLGEKLQTVRQCQKISGCPFTFKQLRSKLKSKPSINSNVPLKDAVSGYNYKQPNSRPSQSFATSEVKLGPPQSSDAFRDPNKGDDEIEEFFGPPPVMIHRPSSSLGFGSNQITGHRRKKPVNQAQFQNNQGQSYNGNSNNFNDNGNEYVPYNPPVKQTSAGSPAQVQDGPKPVFPKKKLGYKIPSYVKKPSGENDEFDDVNKSTGPVTMITDEQVHAENNHQNHQQQGGNKATNKNSNNEANNNQDGQSNDNDGNNNDNDDSDEEDDYNDEGQDYYDDGDDYDGGDNENEEESNEEQDEEDEVSKEDEEKDDENKKESSKSTDVNPEEEDGTNKKYKIKNYKKPGSASVLVVEEFPKRNHEDDELDHPDNVWSKLTFATSGALLKPPKDRNRTKLEEKNNEKLNLSKESDEESDEQQNDKEDEKDEEKEEDDDSEEERLRSRKRKPSSTKFSYVDDEEFEATKDFLPKHKPQRRARPKSHGGSKNKNKSDKEDRKESNVREEIKKKVSEEDTSEEQDAPPRHTLLTQIGGRPLVPPPEKATKQSKKTSSLSRFKFNLVRPYSGDGDSDDEPQTQSKIKPSLPFTKSRTRTELSPDLKFTKPDSSFTKPKVPNLSSNSYSSNSYSSSSYSKNSYKSDTAGTVNKASYLPSMSFGASNGGKVGTVEYLGVPNTPSQKSPSLITFPFAGTLNSLTRFFKRPGGSSSQGNQDIPGNTPQQDGGSAPSPFIHRPVGPESNNFRREHNRPNKARSGNKGSSKGKGKGKKGKKSGNRY